jgi:hypothetical protein
MYSYESIAPERHRELLERAAARRLASEFGAVRRRSVPTPRAISRKVWSWRPRAARARA